MRSWQVFRRPTGGPAALGGSRTSHLSYPTRSLLEPAQDPFLGSQALFALFTERSRPGIDRGWVVRYPVAKAIGNAGLTTLATLGSKRAVLFEIVKLAWLPDQRAYTFIALRIRKSGSRQETRRRRKD